MNWTWLDKLVLVERWLAVHFAYFARKLGFGPLAKDADEITKGLDVLLKRLPALEKIFDRWQSEGVQQKIKDGYAIEHIILELLYVYLPKEQVDADLQMIIKEVSPSLMRAIAKIGLRRVVGGVSVPQGGTVPTSWAKPNSGMHIDEHGNFI